MTDFASTGLALVKGFCAAETAEVLAEELVLAQENATRNRGKTLRNGVFEGPSFSVFAPFDGALRCWMPRVESVVGARLVPINSYARIYTCGSTLLRHADRPFLQVGVSVCLRRDETNWPFCATDRTGRDVSFIQEPGDAVIYDGSLCHWREGQYKGKAQAQVFLHYCFEDGPFAESHRYRQRKYLGPPPEQSPWLGFLQRGYRRVRRFCWLFLKRLLAR